jgi:RNA polymerase sigma-70 factor (ECF subfamily)
MIHASDILYGSSTAEIVPEAVDVFQSQYSRRSVEAVTSRMEVDRSRHMRYLRRRLPSAEDAEDALQDATVKFIQSGHALSSVVHTDAWVGVSLRRIVIDRYRRAAAQRRMIEALATEPSEAIADDDDALVTAAECVKTTMQSLSSDYAAILRQAYLEETPLRDVAVRLDVTANNAAVRLHRARGALRERMLMQCQVCSLGDCWTRQRAVAA